MQKIMLTGITGFVGGRLALKLLEEGFSIRALVRNPDRVSFQHERLELVAGDIRDPERVDGALQGCETAIYLVHGMQEGPDFEYLEAKAAQVFAAGCRKAGIRRIIYLGGLGEEGSNLSPHLRSRHLTGDVLRIPGIPVIEFRASIVIGKGSTSFAIVSALVNRLPFFVEPVHLTALCQPIHVDDLLTYLRAAVEREVQESALYEIGGPDRVSYSGLLALAAEHAGLRRKCIPVPAIELPILKEAFELICPEYARVGGHLFESLIHPTIADTGRAFRDFPEVVPVSLREALDREGGVRDESQALLSISHILEIVKRLEDRFQNLGPLRSRLFSLWQRIVSG
jgi:uncharacterized protein YbjT (DUF2867 family)